MNEMPIEDVLFLADIGFEFVVEDGGITHTLDTEVNEWIN